MTELNVELKPCPFCDGPVHKHAVGEVAGAVHIGMPHCPVTSYRVMTASQWNARSDNAELLRLQELVRVLGEALEFYADESGWNEPPIKTRETVIGTAYENQASKVRWDRGRIALAALNQLNGGAK